MILASLANDIAAAVVIGVITGAVYSLVALGIVLIYKSSGVFNFAQGEFGTVAVYALFAAINFWNLPYGLGIVVALAGAVLMGLATERFVIRPLFDAPRVTLLVATAGVALLAIGVEFWRSGDQLLKVLPPVSQELQRFTVPFADISISDQRLIGLLALAAVTVALVAFFRSPWGLAVLAASQEPTAAELVGVSVKKVSSLTWGMAGFLGGLAGIVAGPTSQFQPGFLTGGSGALIPGFTAAVVGGMTSLPGAVAGGLIIGIAESLGGISAFSDIKGAGAISVFGLLLLVLLVRPQGLFGGRS